MLAAQFIMQCHQVCHCEEAAGRRGNLAVPDQITGKPSAKNAPPSSFDCHVASLLRNDTSGSAVVYQRPPTVELRPAGALTERPLQSNLIAIAFGGTLCISAVPSEIATAFGPRNDNSGAIYFNAALFGPAVSAPGPGCPPTTPGGLPYITRKERSHGRSGYRPWWTRSCGGRGSARRCWWGRAPQAAAGYALSRTGPYEAVILGSLTAAELLRFPDEASAREPCSRASPSTTAPRDWITAVTPRRQTGALARYSLLAAERRLRTLGVQELTQRKSASSRRPRPAVCCTAACP